MSFVTDKAGVQRRWRQSSCLVLAILPLPFVAAVSEWLLLLYIPVIITLFYNHVTTRCRYCDALVLGSGNKLIYVPRLNPPETCVSCDRLFPEAQVEKPKI
jgi:hypothetical protein